MDLYGRDLAEGGQETVELLAVFLHHVAEVADGEAKLLGSVHVGMDEAHELVVALDDDALVDHHHRVELVFDLLGIDVLSVGAEKHVLDASADEDVALTVDGGEVAGVKPSVLVEHGVAGLGILVVAQHDVRAAREDLARHVGWVGTGDAYLHVVHHPSAGAAHEVAVVAVGDERGRLGRAVAHGQGKSDMAEEVLHLAVEPRAAKHHLEELAAEDILHLLEDARLDLLVDHRHVEQQVDVALLDEREHHLADDLLDDHRHDDDDGGMDVGTGALDERRAGQAREEEDVVA